MKVHFEQQACLIDDSCQLKHITSAKLKELRTSVMKAEKEIGELKQMALNLHNLREYIY